MKWREATQNEFERYKNSSNGVAKEASGRKYAVASIGIENKKNGFSSFAGSAENSGWNSIKYTRGHNN